MRDTLLAKFPNAFLFSVFCFVMLCPLVVVNAQQNSASSNLEGTEWQGQTISQANIDGSITNLYRIYTFEGQGKVSLTILISKGVGVATAGTPYGNIPYSTASKSVGTYKISGKSIHIDLPDRVIEATMSDNVMRGILTVKSNNQKEEWLVEKFIPAKKSSDLFSSNKYSAPVDSPIIGTWKYQDGCRTTELFGQTSTNCDRYSTYIYSQDGNVESIHIINLFASTINGNWKYTAADKSSGVLEEFKDDKLVEKGSVKFLGKSQLQYTLTFSVNLDSVGKIYIWNKQ
jgi:hypothetical protein